MLPHIAAKLLIASGIAVASVSTSQAAILTGTLGIVALSRAEGGLDQDAHRQPGSSVVDVHVVQAQQIIDSRSRREANAKLAVSGAREILARIEEYKRRPETMRPPWARRMAPEPVQRDGLYWLPDGSLHPVFEGIHPDILFFKLHDLAHTGRVSKDEFNEIREMVAVLPHNLFRIPYKPLD